MELSSFVCIIPKWVISLPFTPSTVTPRTLTLYPYLYRLLKKCKLCLMRSVATTMRLLLTASAYKIISNTTDVYGLLQVEVKVFGFTVLVSTCEQFQTKSKRRYQTTLLRPVMIKASMSFDGVQSV